MSVEAPVRPSPEKIAYLKAGLLIGRLTDLSPNRDELRRSSKSNPYAVAGIHSPLTTTWGNSPEGRLYFDTMVAVRFTGQGGSFGLPKGVGADALIGMTAPSLDGTYKEVVGYTLINVENEEVILGARYKAPKTDKPSKAALRLLGGIQGYLDGSDTQARNIDPLKFLEHLRDISHNIPKEERKLII